MLVAKYSKIREKMEERGQRKTPSLQNKKYEVFLDEDAWVFLSFLSPYLTIYNAVSPWAPTTSSFRGWTIKSMPSIGNAPKRMSLAPGITSAGQIVFLFFQWTSTPSVKGCCI